MVLNNGTRLAASTGDSPSLQVIEISSDSEDDVFHQPHLSKFGSTRKGRIKCPHESCPAPENDVIELTDSNSSNSELPDMLSPLVKWSQRTESAGSGRRPSSHQFIPLYVDTSDDEDSDNGCILVLNDPPGFRRPVQIISPTKSAPRILFQHTHGNPALNSPKENAAPGVPQVTGGSPGKKSGCSVSKTKEEARRQEYAAELFAELNKEIFGNRLPKDTTLEWSRRLLTTAGRARWHRSREGMHTTKIELASKILDCDERIRNTLSHEMCHLACWVIDDQPREGHGQLFKLWANKVMHKHPDICVSTRHNYEISYPYEWKCEKCSKMYGRYSKSIRPDECVCGACKVGKLIPLFVQRKPVPKVSSMAMAGPPDSPRPIAKSPTKDSHIVLQTAPPPTKNVDKSIAGLVDALTCISISGTEGKSIGS